MHTENMSSFAPVFELPIAVQPADIDEMGHVNNVVYVRWVQDAAVAHWRSLAPAEDQEKLFWVVLRHEIDYKQPAYKHDAIVARTWVGEASRVKFERFTELVRAEDRAVLAQARTVWCPIDAKTRRITSVSDEVRARFSTVAGK
jgi:acyl-CoA thioester hydrolase